MIVVLCDWRRINQIYGFWACNAGNNGFVYYIYALNLYERVGMMLSDRTSISMRQILLKISLAELRTNSELSLSRTGHVYKPLCGPDANMGRRGHIWLYGIGVRTRISKRVLDVFILQVLNNQYYGSHSSDSLDQHSHLLVKHQSFLEFGKYLSICSSAGRSR